MKTILVPTQHIATMKSALETAVVLARRTGAYIEGFPLRVAIPPYVVAELTAGLTMDAYDTQRDEELAELRRTFESFMQEHDIPPSSGTAGNRVSFGWLAAAPEDEGFIGSHGRAFDITVVSRLDADSTGLQRRAIESALFESGRPVLLAPPAAPRQIATNIMVHWNGSTEQSRANAFAMPLLQQAERVTVLTVIGGQDVPGPPADDILRQLQHNGIAARAVRVKLGDRETGEAVLDSARAEGCDLLVKGAFTRNRLRQMIFGGATSHIMEHADIPVLMAH
jgi:nucleotide-binding universal stress UspA family protein